MLTSRSLHKYISTVSQVMALTPNELEWLTGHLGHNNDVHKLFQGMHISTIEPAKVSKLLTAVDEGKAHLYAGKSMQDIDLNDVPALTDVNTAEGSEENRVHGDLDHKKKLPKEDEDEDVEHCTLPIKPQSGSDSHKLVEVKQQNRKHRGPSVQIDSNDDWDITSTKCCKSVKVPRSAEEKDVILSAFGMLIKQRRLPGKKECEKVKANSGSVLANRTWRQIKHCVKNMITSSHRMTTKVEVAWATLSTNEL